MAFKEFSEGQIIDIKTQKDEPIEGFYVGKKQISTELGKQNIFRLQKDGAITGIYGFSNLNRIMGDIAEGTLIRLTYTGMINCKTKYGMKDVHQCKVEIDEEASQATTNEDEDL